MSVKPITPTEAVVLKNSKIPDKVISAFNEVIAKHFNGTYSTFTQDEVVDKIEGLLDCRRDFIFEAGYLDVEQIYQKQGWDVEYDVADYGGFTTTSRFTFIKQKSNPHLD
jgi:hypothetical protein